MIVPASASDFADVWYRLARSLSCFISLIAELEPSAGFVRTRADHSGRFVDLLAPATLDFGQPRADSCRKIREYAKGFA
jgi:hypothetical protein